MYDALVGESMANGDTAAAAAAKAIGKLDRVTSQTQKRTAGIEHLLANRLVVRKMVSMVPGALFLDWGCDCDCDCAGAVTVTAAVTVIAAVTVL